MKKAFGFSGVGENRTLVQTSNQKGFYTLSFLLNFRLKARLETATISLALSVSERIQNITFPRFTFTVLLCQTP